MDYHYHFSAVRFIVPITAVKLFRPIRSHQCSWFIQHLLKTQGSIQAYPEMGIYRHNSSAIVIGDNFLLIIVVAQNSLDLSITDIAFVIYFVIADKLSQ